MEVFIQIVTVVLSMLAFGVSVVNAYNQKKEILANTIATNRMKWIIEVRELMGLFLEKYIKQEERFELSIIKAKIDLYIIYEKDAYDEFEKKLQYCVQNDYSDSDYKELVALSQKVLNDVWIRIKMESGISRKEDKKMAEYFNRRQKVKIEG